MFDILVISVSNPLLIGLYKDEKLVKEYELEGKTSEVLPKIFKKITKLYELRDIYYVNSPGSYMAIKVAYVFLKTFAISKDIELFATKGFHFNENSPIKALGKKYFFYENNKILIDFLKENDKILDFKLPKILNKKIFNNNAVPEYNLPAV